ncbi:hypothetical protein COV19_05890 [Candidatus Woesearchaeota archaeon CG10_big_fil_rev_8_21_14_0_10_44_13]|nr:MAG: hypothetical protein COV19_05890 [Candidatus Woesearchaeota archaeon CG10_big_fil_rev_8_21_14_0_10_44_13]
MVKKEKIHDILHKIEYVIDKSIPYLVILLLVLIVVDLAFEELISPYEFYVSVLDYFILAVFCIDLVFKYIKVRKIPEFLKKHWLDIIAVFPFFLVFRLFEQIYLISNLPQLFMEPPTILHEGIVLEREGLRLMKTAERTEKLSRTRLIVRLIRPIQRIPRLLKILPYFEKPTKEHHNVIEDISKEKSGQSKQKNR